jgi:hypothetical protein
MSRTAATGPAVILLENVAPESHIELLGSRARCHVG